MVNSLLNFGRVILCQKKLLWSWEAWFSCRKDLGLREVAGCHCAGNATRHSIFCKKARYSPTCWQRWLEVRFGDEHRISTKYHRILCLFEVSEIQVLLGRISGRQKVCSWGQLCLLYQPWLSYWSARFLCSTILRFLRVGLVDLQWASMLSLSLLSLIFKFASQKEWNNASVLLQYAHWEWCFQCFCWHLLNSGFAWLRFVQIRHPLCTSLLGQSCEVDLAWTGYDGVLQRISNLKFCLVVLPYPQRVFRNMRVARTHFTCWCSATHHPQTSR